jgi:hypothetical protein
VDWIERLFGISPDGGDGYFEWVIVLFVAFLVAAAVLRRVRSFRSTAHAGVRTRARTRDRWPSLADSARLSGIGVSELPPVSRLPPPLPRTDLARAMMRESRFGHWPPKDDRHR